MLDTSRSWILSIFLRVLPEPLNLLGKLSFLATNLFTSCLSIRFERASINLLSRFEDLHVRHSVIQFNEALILRSKWIESHRREPCVEPALHNPPNQRGLGDVNTTKVRERLPLQLETSRFLEEQFSISPAVVGTTVNLHHT